MALIQTIAQTKSHQSDIGRKYKQPAGGNVCFQFKSKVWFKRSMLMHTQGSLAAGRSSISIHSVYFELSANQTVVLTGTFDPGSQNVISIALQ